MYAIIYHVIDVLKSILLFFLMNNIASKNPKCKALEILVIISYRWILSSGFVASRSVYVFKGLDCCCFSGTKLWQLSVTLRVVACQAPLSSAISQSLFKCMSVMYLPSHPLPPAPQLPSIFPSVRDFSTESTLCVRWPGNWSITFSISPSNEYSGLISFRMDWFDLLAVQGTLKNHLQYHNSKPSVLQHSAFLIVWLISIHVCW